MNVDCLETHVAILGLMMTCVQLRELPKRTTHLRRDERSNNDCLSGPAWL
uniref:Uncharacterized protein n=1 Tax=Aegilops tauschii subsp. strangulata TaxID=200361 RepID=A0A453CPL2_AEGTS